MRIICSIGPKTNNLATLVSLAKEGMNTVRLNFSHIDYAEASELIHGIRTTLPEVQIVADMQGPKLRVSNKFEGELMVRPRDRAIFCHEKEYEKMRGIKDMVVVPVQFDGDFQRLKSAKAISMKDATMHFEILGFQNNFIGTQVVEGGVIRGEKGLNAPGMDREGLDLTSKDQKDIVWALKHGVDVICLSFVTSASDITRYKEYVSKLGLNTKILPKVWAKIETTEGLAHIDKIIKEVDGIMLGRGDLSAELGVTRIPQAQEMLLEKLKKSSKELIIATYVLETMKQNPFPSVAECSDIYRSLKQNVSGFMLTGEVGVGKHPVRVVKALAGLIDDYHRKD